MLSTEDGRSAPDGSAVPKGRVLVPLKHQRQEEIRLAAHDIVVGLQEQHTPKHGRLLDFAPVPRTQDDGTPFKAKTDRKFFYSGERMAYPK